MWIVATGTVFKEEMAPPEPGMTIVTGDTQRFPIRFMLRMTTNATGKFMLVLHPIGSQVFSLLVMTGCTKLPGDVLCRGQIYLLRLMGLMAKLTIGGGHRIIMGSMTIGTNTGDLVITVTFRTILLTVATRFSRKRLDNRLVTTGTNL